ncbi:MAG: helix-turn-helix domain-containing protein [Xanthobacteraceae bacterium]|nr:helix-turn-helix domain-containing protein [Xanthobacteraceae bacterium]
MEPSFQQIRAARALLGWTQQKLAEEAGVGVMTVKRLETGAELRLSQRRAVGAALVAAGIIFIADGTEIGAVATRDGVAIKRSD